MPTPIGLVIVVILCTGICYFVAKKRGAKRSFWVLMGALFGPLAIPFVFFSKPVSASGPVR